MNITARLNALKAILASTHPNRHEIVAEAGRVLRKSLNGYTGYLGVIASDPRESVFAAMTAEEKRAGWSIRHPALSRALYCGFAANGDQIWTPQGLAWMEKTIVKYAQVSEYNALRLLAPFALWKRFPKSLREDVKALLDRVAEALPRDTFAFIGGRLAALR